MKFDLSHQVMKTDWRCLCKGYWSKYLELRGRKMRNKELHNLYSQLNIVTMIRSKRMRGSGHAAHIGKCIQCFGTKAEEKRSLGRRTMQGCGLDSSGSGQDHWQAFRKTVTNIWVPQNAKNFFNSWVTNSSSRRTRPHAVSYKIHCYNINLILWHDMSSTPQAVAPSMSSPGWGLLLFTYSCSVS
jgi:hypothetical protein